MVKGECAEQYSASSLLRKKTRSQDGIKIAKVSARNSINLWPKIIFTILLCRLYGYLDGIILLTYPHG